MKQLRFLSLMAALLLLLLLSACGGVLQVDLEPTGEPGVVDETPLPTSPATEAVATETAAPATEEPAAQPEETSAAEEATATSEPATGTPQPEAAGVAQVAYVKDGNAYLWSSATAEQTLTNNGGVEDVDLSPDGARVAFIRGGHLWVVNGDGSDERQLTDDEDFAGIDFGDIADLVVGVGVYQMAWVPGTPNLLFNTIPYAEGPGLLLSNDLWRVDTQSGELVNLRPAGDGGNFVLSPDGNQVALITPGTISVMHLDGGQEIQVLTYAPVLTYSEHQYYARPVWAPDGATLRVVIPPADPLGQPAPTTIYELYPDGRPARLLDQVTVFMPQSHGNVAIAPDLAHLAFLQQPAEGSPGDLFLAPLGQELGEPLRYAQAVSEIQSWSPSGAHLAFSHLSDGMPQLLLGAVDAAPQPLGATDAGVIGLQWADGEQFVYLQQSPRGWDLILLDLAGDGEIIAAIAGAPPNFDVEK